MGFCKRNVVVWLEIYDVDVEIILYIQWIDEMLGVLFVLVIWYRCIGYIVFMYYKGFKWMEGFGWVIVFVDLVEFVWCV